MTNKEVTKAFKQGYGDTFRQVVASHRDVMVDEWYDFLDMLLEFEHISQQQRDSLVVPF